MASFKHDVKKNGAAGAAGASASVNNKKQGTKPTTSQSGKQQSLYPAMVQQLRGALPDPREPGKLRLDGWPLTEVTVVGQVQDLDDKDPTSLCFSLVDSTGTILIQAFADRLADPDQYSDIKSGKMVRAIGSLRGLSTHSSNGLFIHAFHLRAVTHPDEVEFHKLDAQDTRARIAARLNAGKPLDNKNDAGKKEILVQVVAQVEKAMEVSKESDRGMTLEEIYTALPACKQSDILAAIHKMQEDGTTYNTSDDHHYKLTA